MSSQDGESNGDGGAGRMSAGEEEDPGATNRGGGGATTNSRTTGSTSNNNHHSKQQHTSSAGANHNDDSSSSDRVIGSAALRPVFLGNLMPEYAAEVVFAAFEQPTIPHAEPVYVDRVDIKRGYCFVFLKDARSQSDKRRIEEFVSKINGIEVPTLSRAVRAEFARGDGRVKRKEDERRKNIAPSETLFVVNFHEETTKKEDLEMLFGPFGELVRIDMKRNYAFVQFKTIEQATKAKENTNGGKIDQSVLTVEYVARQRALEQQRGSSRGRDNRVGGRTSTNDRFPMDDRARGPPRYDDRGRSGPNYGGPPPPRSHGGGRYDDDRYSRGGGRGRSPSPPPRRGGRSRSRSPPRYGRSRSPPPRRSTYNNNNDDDYHHRGGYRRASRSPSPPPRRGPSPEPEREFYRGDRDRGYRG